MPKPLDTSATTNTDEPQTHTHAHTYTHYYALKRNRNTTLRLAQDTILAKRFLQAWDNPAGTGLARLPDPITRSSQGEGER